MKSIRLMAILSLSLVAGAATQSFAVPNMDEVKQKAAGYISAVIAGQRDFELSDLLAEVNLNIDFNAVKEKLERIINDFASPIRDLDNSSLSAEERRISGQHIIEMVINLIGDGSDELIDKVPPIAEQLGDKGQLVAKWIREHGRQIRQRLDEVKRVINNFVGKCSF